MQISASKFLDHSHFLVSLWLLIVLCSSIFAAVKIAEGNAFTGNILSLLPTQSQRGSALFDAFQASAERRFAILVQGSSEPDALNAVRELRSSLWEFSRVSVSSPNGKLETVIQEELRLFSHQLLDEQTRNQLISLSSKELTNNALAALYSPVPEYRLHSFTQDPFNLGGKWLSGVLGRSNIQSSEFFYVDDGEKRWYILNGELQASPYTLDAQEGVQMALNSVSTRFPDVDFITSGLVFHAAEGARIARAELSTVGLGSLLVVVALVILAFRSLAGIGFLVTVLGCSCLVALSVSLLIFDQVHLITLAFGTTLLGLAADYCFHFLVKRKACGDSLVARRYIGRGLFISVISSVAAYLMQLMSPFPGLAQFAVFVASGLLAAGISVWLFAPCMSETKVSSMGLANCYESFLKSVYMRVAHQRALVAVLTLALVIAAAIGLYQRGSNDNILLLNTSGDELIASEEKAAALLGGFDAQRYFLITGETSQQVLEKSELLAEKVASYTGKHADDLLMLPEVILPSVRRQNENYQLVKDKLFSANGALMLLCQQLPGGCPGPIKMPDFQPLEYSQLPQSLSNIIPVQAIMEDDALLVFLRRGASDYGESFKQIALPEVEYIDRIEAVSGILKKLRQQVEMLLAAFFLSLSVFCVLLFGRQSIAVLGPIFVSTIFALFVASPGGVTLFHVLALLLVIGITLDTGVFFVTPGLDGNTWTASTLACLSSLVAFGLLSLSRVPVLHQFGTVVFVGLSVAWLATPVFRLMFKASRVEQGRMNT